MAALAPLPPRVQRRVGDHSAALTYFKGPHFALAFQDGPIGVYGVNGTTDEELIGVLIDRLESLNKAPYQTPENATAIGALRVALRALEQRTALRMKRGVEGTVTP